MSWKKSITGPGRKPGMRDPLFQRDDLLEGNSSLLTVEGLLARSSGTIHDSIWAPTNTRNVARPPLSQKTNIKTEPVSASAKENQAPLVQEKRPQVQGLQASRWCDNLSRNDFTSTAVPALNQAANNPLPVDKSAKDNTPPHLRTTEAKTSSSVCEQASLGKVIGDQIPLELSKSSKPSPFALTPGSQNWMPPHFRGLITIKEETSGLAGLSQNKLSKDDSTSLTNTSVDRSSEGVLRLNDSAKQTKLMQPELPTAAPQDRPTNTTNLAKAMTPVTPCGRSSSNNLTAKWPLTAMLQEDAFLKYIESQAANLHGAKRYRQAIPSTSPDVGTQRPKPDHFDDLEMSQYESKVPVGDLGSSQAKSYKPIQFLRATDQTLLSTRLPASLETQDSHAPRPADFEPNFDVARPQQVKDSPKKILVSSKDTPLVDGWIRKPLPTGIDLVNSIYTELKENSMLPPSTTKLTWDAIVEKTGHTTRPGIVTFDDKISDAGIQGRPKEIVRWTQGEDARKELAGIGGSFMPVKCDWEIDRTAVDKSYIPNYIKEWQNSGLPGGLGYSVDMTADGFRSGTRPVINFKLGDLVIHPDCVPDIQNSENEKKRFHQTALIDATNMARKWELQEKRNAALQKQADAYYKEIQNQEPEIDPFDPKIPCYFRPATQQDINQIAGIYNHYVKNENVTEDQKPISEEDCKNLFAYCKKETLPIIVGIKGGDPMEIENTSGRKYQPKKFVMPKQGVVVGFAFVEVWNYGISGTRNGRSRNSANFQFYVHHEYTRKGIGRNLLDHMIYIMYRGAFWRNRTTFINPGNNEAYGQGGGGHWHQLLVQYPVLRKADPNYEWFKKWLENLFPFEETARLRSVARTSTHQGKNAQFMDVVVFQLEAHAAMEFDFEADA